MGKVIGEDTVKSIVKKASTLGIDYVDILKSEAVKHHEEITGFAKRWLEYEFDGHEADEELKVGSKEANWYGVIKDNDVLSESINITLILGSGTINEIVTEGRAVYSEDFDTKISVKIETMNFIASYTYWETMGKNRSSTGSIEFLKVEDVLMKYSNIVDIVRKKGSESTRMQLGSIRVPVVFTLKEG